MSALDPTRRPSPLTVNLGIALLCLVWGSTWIVIRTGLDDLPPFTAAGARFVVAAVVMALVLPLLDRREGGGRPPTWLWVVMGVLNFGACYGIVYWSETILPSALTAILWAVFPLLMGVLGHLYLEGERLRSVQWLGLVVGFAGVVLLFFTDLEMIGPDAVRAGAVLLLSPVVVGVGTVFIKRFGSTSSSLRLNRNGMALGAVLLLTLAAFTERDAELRWTRAAVGSVLYLALIGTVVTFGIYYWLLRFAPAYKMSLIAYVTPAIAVFLGRVVRDEPVTRFTLLGGLLIFLGVLVVARR